ncbi:MAG: T9SS type A sorting domain-containing protein, partial [Hymenobacter sp.]
VIEYVYNAASAATVGAEIGRYASIGIKGSGVTAGQTVLITKTSSVTTWPNATITTGAGTRFFFRRTVGPDAGRTFRFTPINIPANDASILALYTLPKLAIPASTPHVVRTAVVNAGSARLDNLVVTLRVTGSNPFTTTTTVPRVAVGDTVVVAFPGFSPTVLGNNTVSVSVPSDGNNTNNSQTTSQVVTTNTAGYTRLNEGNSSGLTTGTGGGIFVARFSSSITTTVNSVSIFLASFTGFSPVGRTVYAVVTNPTTGAITGRSADYVITAADVNTMKSFPITAVGTTTPLTVQAGDFMAGLAIPAFTGTLFYPLGLQGETPTRPNSFFSEDLAGSVPVDAARDGYGVFMIDTNLGTTPSCVPPTAATFTAVTGTTAQVSFTGGSASPASYTIIYGPAGFDPTSTTAGTIVTSTTLPISLTGLTPNSVYQVYVRTNCSATSQSSLSGPFQLQTGCAANTVIAAFPYSENFDNIIPGLSLPCGVTVLDANTDGATWALNKVAANSSPNAMRYTSALNNSVAANDWFFTPALTTAANTRYQVAFRYRGEGIVNSTSNYVEKLEVKVGNAATVAAQTTTLFTNANITNTSYSQANATSTPAVAVFTPGAGTQYVGFHVYSDATQGNRTFDLEIHGANAKSNLGVLVTNTLGQQVYTGSARDNYTNKLDLSGLAAGLYHLQVRNGDETMTRQIAIVK